MSFKTSFQWFADFNTSTTGMQIVQFSAGGEVVRRRLAPMFAHYRKYKLGAIHVKFVPAATLPVDPTGLSYDEGDQTVDPRDMFNPGLVRNTNGEDIFVPDETVLNSDMADSLYYSTMLDKRWKKFRMQRGITLRAFPKFWGVANLRQNNYPGYVNNIPGIVNSGSSTLNGVTRSVAPITVATSGSGVFSLSGTFDSGSSPMGLFQTGQKIPMGWMPTGASLKDEFGLLNGLTDTLTYSSKWKVVPPVGFSDLIATFDTQEAAQAYLAEITPMFPEDASGSVVEVPVTMNASDIDDGTVFAPVPEIPDLLTLCLPRSHKTQFFYRVYVKEDVYFRDPVTSINAIGVANGESYLAPLDVFNRSILTNRSPGEPVVWDDDRGTPLNDGGTRNGGDGGNI